MRLIEKHSNGNIPPFAADGTRYPLTWVVVADAENALIYQYQLDKIELIALAKPDDNRGDVDENSVYAANENLHKVGEFAKDVACWLDIAERGQAFDRLVIIAAPYTLGDISAALPENVRDHLQAQLERDFAAMTPEDLFDNFPHLIH